MDDVKYNFPFDIKPLEATTNAELLLHFTGEKTGFVQVGPEKYFFPYKYKEEAEYYYNFEARPTDIWVVTFPRSGTTWTQELVWLVANNLNFEAAKQHFLTERFPFFEFSLFVHPHIKEKLLKENAENCEALAFIEKMCRPGYESLDTVDVKCRRFIKTHFPFSLLPPSVMKQGCKIIYIARNPKDVAVSYYHLNRLYRTQGYTGDFERYWDYFERGFNAWMPYYSHIKEALHHRHMSNVLFLKYEDMQSDMNSAIEKVSKFLNQNLTVDGVEKLKSYLSITNFRNNSAVNGHEMEAIGVLNKGDGFEGFVRNGTFGIQKEFADNQNLLYRVNEWIAKKEREMFGNLQNKEF